MRRQNLSAKIQSASNTAPTAMVSTAQEEGASKKTLPIKTTRPRTTNKGFYRTRGRGLGCALWVALWVVLWVVLWVAFWVTLWVALLATLLASAPPHAPPHALLSPRLLEVHSACPTRLPSARSRTLTLSLTSGCFSKTRRFFCLLATCV